MLNAQVVATDVLLAVIGPRWSELLTARANDPDDFVAIEIKAALENNKRVIPVRSVAQPCHALVCCQRRSGRSPDVTQLAFAQRDLDQFTSSTGLHLKKARTCAGLIIALKGRASARGAVQVRQANANVDVQRGRGRDRRRYGNELEGDLRWMGA